MKHSNFITVMLALSFSFTLYGQLQFSQTKSINSLQLKKEAKDYSTGSITKIVSLQVSTNSTEKFTTQNQFDLFHIDGLTTIGKTGEPTTYVKSLKVELEKDARITGIRILDADYVDIIGKINLAPRGKPVVWMKDAQNDLELKRNMEIYSRDEYFPGKTVNYIAGQGKDNTIVYIQLFPVQYNPVKREALLITNATIEINYIIDTKPKPVSRSSFSRSNAENIIITTLEFKPYADSIKNLHETLESITTDVVTIDWIIANYTAAPDPTQPGYGNISTNPVNDNYNYDLAKKIIAYLRDDDTHPNLESITILGDAGKIPPSYYFYIYHYSHEYDNWICSDLFYSSPDYDMVLNYEVGRLPANNIAEAQLMFQKLKNWKTNLDENWFNNVQLVGGAPFHNKVLFGEIMTLDIVNKGYLKGMNIIGKNFLSKGTQNSANVLPYFSDENTGILYHIGHGDGKEIGLGAGQAGYGISTSDLLSLPSKEKYPVVITIACQDGGYDTELITAPFNTRCFAEGVMCSQAGGIAFWGSTRTSYGSPYTYFMPNGKMIVGDEPQMAGILTNVFKSWSEGDITFGAINNHAFSDFVQTSGLDWAIDKATAYEFVFFGDPALSLLPQDSSSYNNVDYVLDPLPNTLGASLEPVYYKTSTSAIPVNITGFTNSPSVGVDIYDIEIDTLGVVTTNNLVNTNINTPPFEYVFTPQEERTYFSCYETDDFKETRLYFKTEVVSQLSPVAAHLNEIQNLTGGNFDLEWASAKDYDGQIISYTLFEGKNQFAAQDSCNNFENWENFSFSVISGGNNSGNCFYSGIGYGDTVILITSIQPYFVKQGDQLSFWKKYYMEYPGDAACVEIAEFGQPFTKLESYSGSENNIWTQSTIDLSAYVGKQILIRFMYQVESGGMPNNGFWIDDIKPVGLFEETRLIESITDTAYHIANNPTGDYYYKIKAYDNDNLVSKWSNTQKIHLIVGIQEEDGSVNNISLSKNYPNPFNISTTISYWLQHNANVNIEIYNMQGQLVRNLINAKQQHGNHKAVWDGNTKVGEKVGKGIYFYKISVIPMGGEPGYTDIQKMILIK